MDFQIRPATMRDLCYTAANAREIDKKEILASGPETMQAAGFYTWHTLVQCGGEGYVVWIDGNPEVSFGFSGRMLMPHLFDAWAWGSEKFRLAMPTMARWGREELPPLVNRLGARRIEARSIIDHTEAHRWLEWISFRREAELRGWGKGGETFVQYGWVKDDFLTAEHRGSARYCRSLMG